MHSLNQILTKSIKQPIITLFFISLIVSLGWHISLRNNHFQEGDSSAVYNILYEFPAAALRSTALSYKPGSFLSEETAHSILTYPAVQKIRSAYLSKFSDNFILNQLTHSSFLATFRFGLIQVVSMAPLPFTIQGFFSLPLGSTYSSGAGFTYSIFSGIQTNYKDFMSRSMIISITLFHIAVALLFIINRRLNISDFINVVISFCLLFSISAYSSGIHIGSTVWNFTTEFLWLWFVLKYHDLPNFNKKVSLVSGILVYFNYLILFFWFSLMLINFIKFLETSKITPRAIAIWIWNTIRAQWAAILLIGICGILFYQPGQGFRGATSLSGFSSDFYYIVLNFFSWYTHNQTLNILQFLLGLTLLGCGLFFLISKSDQKDTSDNQVDRKLIKSLLRSIAIVYVILVVFKILSFAPTRHILFLIPLVFISAAVGLDMLYRKFFSNIPETLQIAKIVILILLGSACLQIRHADAFDRSKGIQVDKDVAMVGIYDSSHNIFYPLKEAGIEVSFINPKDFKPNEIYLYVSQVEPFDRALSEWSIQYDINLKKISEKNIVTDTYFVAYVPDFEHVRYSRPNNLFQTKFKVLDIKKK